MPLTHVAASSVAGATSEWTVLEGVVSVTATLEAGTRPVARIVVDAAKPRADKPAAQ